MKTLKITGFILMVLCGLVACQEEGLEDFALQEGQGIRVGIGTVSGNITKTNESITIPVNLKLSGSASKAFEVSLLINQDTVEKLIAKGEIKDAVAISSGAILIDNVAKVNYGSDVAQFQILVTRTEVEKYFGEKIAIGYTIERADKDNIVDPDQNTGFITINTSDLLTAEDIHYISFQAGGNIVEVKDRQNYVSSSGGISIPLTTHLASFPGSAFSVDVVTDTDTIQELVTSGVLPANTFALQEGDYTIGDRVSFPSNTSEAVFAVDVPWTTINNNLGKQLALVLRLTKPSLHVINPEKNYTTILIDCDNVLEEDVTHLGVFSVNRDHPDGPDHNEGSKKLVDNNFNSKFLLPNFAGDLVCTFVFPEAQKIGAYTFTSGNDAQGRDPKEWTLEASTDGVTWKVIDSRTNESFVNRLMTRRFNIAFPQEYTHYRLNITGIVGGTDAFQMTEWRVIKVL